MAALQTKTTLGRPGDAFEREADTIAAAVMQGAPTGLRCACGGSCPRCHGGNPEAVRARPLTRQISAPAGGMAAPPIVHEAIARPGHGLDAPTLAFFEPRFGHSFDAVRVHTDAIAAASTAAISAEAYTLGRDIVFAAGRYRPDSDAGRHLLAHELTHVLQQEGRSAEGPVQRFLTCEAGADCPPREPGEAARSRTDPMTVERVTSGGVGLMFANFAVDGSAIKGDPTSNVGWNEFVADVRAGTNLRWEIRGFSDCQGDESRNARLRTARATSMFLALPADAQARIDAYSGAALDQCVRRNGSAAERALNRSALMWVTSTSYGEGDFEPEPVTGDNRRRVYMCSKDLDTSPVGSHAFYRLDAPAAGNETISLQPMLMNRTCDCWQGIPDWNYPSDQSAAGSCTLTSFTFADLYREFRAYPIGHYCTLGPNSNTFVGHIARNLGMRSPDPAGVTPGIDDSPPPWGTFAPDKWATLTGCVTKECNCPPDAEEPRDEDILPA